jgi:hypothetical protein
VKSADIIANASELLEDYKQDGEEVFERFNAPKDKILGHYKRAIAAILKKWLENPLAEDLNNLSHKLGELT